MTITPIKTRVMPPPKDNLFAVLGESLADLRERDILLVTSKVLSIHQGRCVPTEGVDKNDLAREEADAYLPREFRPNRKRLLTIKHHTLIASAGIDESNGGGYYVLSPEHPSESAKEIRRYLRGKHGIAECGVVIVDSHSVPLRGGAVGVALGFAGFEPLVRHRGKKDLFGRAIQFERSNIPDALAAGGVLAMGEVAESTPLALIRDVPGVIFTEEDLQNDFFLSRDEDYFTKLFKDFTTP